MKARPRGQGRPGAFPKETLREGRRRRRAQVRRPWSPPTAFRLGGQEGIRHLLLGRAVRQLHRMGRLRRGRLGEPQGVLPAQDQGQFPMRGSLREAGVKRGRGSSSILSGPLDDAGGAIVAEGAASR